MLEGPIKILLVEDDADEVLLVGEAIEDSGADDISLEHAPTLQEALDQLASATFDLVLLDLSLPDSFGIEGVAPVAKAAGKAPVIVCTGLNDEDVGQDAIRRGAQDFLVKNPRLYGAIPRIVRYAVERNRLIQQSNEKVEQAREYTELLLTKVISIANAGLGITNREGAFSLVNPALAQLIGSTTAELVGNSWVSLLAEPHRATELQRYKESFDHHDSYNREELTIQRKDGNTIEVPMRSVLVEFGENRLCRVLSFGSPQKWQTGAAVAPVAGKYVDHLAFPDVEDDTAIATGRLQFVGLQALMAELGNSGKLLEKRISQVAESTIEAHLEPGDSFTRNWEGDYVILFGQLGAQEARSKAQTIGEKIRDEIRALANEGELDEYELSAAKMSNLGDVRADALAVKLAQGQDGDVATLITQQIEEAAARARAKTSSVLGEIQKTYRSSLREATQRGGNKICFMLHEFDADTQRRIAHLKSTLGDRTETLAQIDSIALGGALQCLFELGTRKSSLVAVDIHYSTLINEGLFKDYSSLYQNVAEQACKSLVFFVKEIPRNIGPRDLSAIARSLGPFSRLQMIQLAVPDLSRMDLRAAGIRLVATDYEQILETYTRDPAKCGDLFARVRAAGARSFVNGVTTKDCGFLFNKLGVDFVCYQRGAALTT